MSGGGFTELFQRRDLLLNLTLRELRGKYKRSTLGWAWSMLHPLSTIVIFSMVFGVLLKVDIPPGRPSGVDSFMFFLVCGLLPWNFTASGIMATIPQLVGNANLIKKVYFPREYIVAASVLSWVVTFLIELTVVMVAFLFIAHITVQWLPMLLVLVTMQALFVLGVGMALAVLNVYFRDVQHFSTIFMQVWFYLTPIVYPIEARDDTGQVVRSYIPKTAEVLGIDIPVRTIYRLNPMVEYVQAYRNLLYDGRMPTSRSLLYIVASTLTVLTLGYALFQRLEPRLAEEL